MSNNDIEHCDYCDYPTTPVEHLMELDGQGNQTGRETYVCRDCYLSGIDLVFVEPEKQEG